jgi:hypothetical protein
MMFQEQRLHGRQKLVMEFNHDDPCPIGLKLIDRGL